MGGTEELGQVRGKRMLSQHGAVPDEGRDDEGNPLQPRPTEVRMDRRAAPHNHPAVGATRLLGRGHGTAPPAEWYGVAADPVPGARENRPTGRSIRIPIAARLDTAGAGGFGAGRLLVVGAWLS